MAEAQSMIDAEDGEQKAAVDIANNVAAVLRRTGYDFVIVGICKLIRAAEGKFSLPGATLFEAAPACAPAYPHLARNLRTLADQLDEAFESSGASESPQGYAHLVESVRQAEEPSSLVKDFHVLYRSALALADACNGRGDGRPYPPLRALESQLDRLRPAFEQCEAARRASVEHARRRARKEG